MQIVALLAAVVVGLVLLRGLFNMMKGGSASKSQQLMRLRVAAQAVAVLVMVAAVYWSRGGS